MTSYKLQGYFVNNIKWKKPRWASRIDKRRKYILFLSIFRFRMKFIFSPLVLHVTPGCFLCQHFKINIFFKRGKIKIYQYFDYAVLEKSVPIKKSKTVES